MWATTEVRNESYNVFLTAEVMNEEILKVLITNKYPEQENVICEKVKEDSSFFIQIDVEDVYAVYCYELPTQK